MLTLKGIKKDYPTGAETVKALKGIDLEFRKSEFVSILGPSGCGKTTMLNIIGGLDHYTEGDLIINGRSTKNYRDRDWDSYRNHSIGFVFQSYNLIPHQNVLQNVELALTLSGVSKNERRKRAKEALEKVGLGDQLKKKPSEMSGGQMQRVAIARAIVNDPDIILADEPTGALDTETSVQVMEILKEISKDRLVIMVTHNPELADKYSTRIIRMLDGIITNDSSPITEDEKALQKAEKKKENGKKSAKKPSMSFFTSFGLSLKNLVSKKGRTSLTAFAGSIGIIGIALIMAVSQGTTNYINAIQEETLSSYPITLEAESVDLASLMESFMGQAQSKEPHNKDAIYQKSMVYDLVNALNSTETVTNDLKSFKEHLEAELENESDKNQLNNAVNGVQYTYANDLLVYTKNVDGTILRSDSQALMQELLIEYMGLDMSAMLNMEESYGFSQDSSMMTMMGGSQLVLWQELLPAKNGDTINPLIREQYELIDGGRWPENYNEIVLVVDENNELDDMTLYALGLKSKEEIDALMQAAVDKTTIDTAQQSWSYDEIKAMEFRTVLNSDCFTYSGETGKYIDIRETETGMRMLYDNGIPLKVTGIIRAKADASSPMLKGSICYTYKLTEHIIENSKNSAAVTAQLQSPTKDIFTGLPFKETTGELTIEEKQAEFNKYLSKLDNFGKAETYVKIMSIPSKEEIDAVVAQSIGSMSREDMEAALMQSITAQAGMSNESVAEYTASMTDEEITELFTMAITEQYKAQYAQTVEEQLSSLPVEQKAAALDALAKTFTKEQYATYYDEVLEFSSSTYDENLVELGYVDISSPASINIYASSFENKDIIEEFITEYNSTKDEISKISYTDYIGIMLSSITTIIDAISYVLIAFVSVSLVVSSIMIAVITLISVQERTKEIGILRAIGASKRNVSAMFNAETIIIGFSSGLLGVVITALLCIPINAILQHFTGIANLRASLPLGAAVILVIISTVLNLISGVIPSRSAAKKDPVVALRTE